MQFGINKQGLIFFTDLQFVVLEKINIMKYVKKKYEIAHHNYAEVKCAHHHYHHHHILFALFTNLLTAVIARRRGDLGSHRAYERATSLILINKVNKNCCECAARPIQKLSK